MDCEYYPVEALTERHRLLSLLSRFLKGKPCSPDFCWDFTAFLADYHDLLCPPSADSEAIKAGKHENEIFLSVEIGQVSDEADEDDFCNWDDELEEIEQACDDEEPDQEKKP